MSELSPAEAKALLDRRARALAAAPPGEDSTERVALLVFSLGRETYAVELRFVREATRLSELTQVPGLQPFFSGVTNVRGEILALIDLRGFLGVQAKGLTDASKAIVLGRQRAELAILADDLRETAALPLHALREAPSSTAGIGARYLKGVTKEALIVLDAEKLLDDPRLTVNQERRKT